MVTMLLFRCESEIGVAILWRVDGEPCSNTTRSGITCEQYTVLPTGGVASNVSVSVVESNNGVKIECGVVVPENNTLYSDPVWLRIENPDDPDGGSPDDGSDNGGSSNEENDNGDSQMRAYLGTFVLASAFALATV